MNAISLPLLLGSLVMSAPAAPDAAQVRARLDGVIEAKWKTLNITPEAAADDTAFLRRIYLDLTGRVPPAAKVSEFLADRDPGKRARLVEALLNSEEFAEHWGRVWTEAFTGKRPTKQDTYDGRLLAEYLKESLRANKSYRQVVTELICAEGLNDTSGPANFLLRYDVKPTDLAGAVGKHFLGVTIHCAQCHDHPFAHWKKDDFWGVAGFFGRIRRLQGTEDQTSFAVLETRRGELLVPDTAAKPNDDGNVPMKKISPRLPVEKSPLIDGNRRQALAAWVTASDNPYFSRHLVNRVWGQLFGSPLVNGLDKTPVDIDGRHPQVLDLLAQDFTASGHDVKRLVRIIVLSRAYQLGAGNGDQTAGTDEKAVEMRHHKVRNLARFPIRPLSVDQLYQSLVVATGHRGDPPVDPDNQAEQKAEEKDEDANMPPDRPVDLLTDRAMTVQRSLALLNGAYVHDASQAGVKAAVRAKGEKLGAAHVEWLFLATLSRKPTAAETSTMLGLLKDSEGTQGLEDVLWVILNSAEFTTNH
jgi:hypothetical protein